MAAGRPDPYRKRKVRAGLYKPYPLRRIFRGFSKECRDGVRLHQAIDIGGVGEHAGLGTPIRSMVRAKITRIGRPEDNPKRYGTRERGSGKVKRGRREYPASLVVKGYGRVYFFTSKRGRWRTGVLIETVGKGGVLDGYKLRYMHLGEVRPDLKVGDIVEAGDEIGVHGCTGVQNNAPHVHIDVRDPLGIKVDIVALLGRGPTNKPCPPSSEPAKPDPKLRVWRRSLKLERCKVTTIEEDFSSGRFDVHDVLVRLGSGRDVTVSLKRTAGKWKPRVMLLGMQGRVEQRNGKEGKTGGRATVGLTATADTKMTLRVTAWPSRKLEDPLPRDAKYRLEVTEICP